MGNGHPHVRVAQLRQYRAIHVFDHRMDDALRMDQHIEPFGWHVEQHLRLDQLQPLVHQRGRIDGNLAAHRPPGVPAGLIRCGGGDLPGRPGAEWPTGRGEDQPAHGLLRIHAGTAVGQALEDGVVLAIDRQQRHAGCPAGAGKQRPGHDDRFLVGQQQCLCRPGRSQCGRQTGCPHDGGHDQIHPGRASHLGQLVGPHGQPGLHARAAQACLEPRRRRRMGNGHDFGPVALGQRQQLVDVATGRERVHAIAFRMAGHDIEGAVTDGAGCPQNGNGFHG